MSWIRVLVVDGKGGKDINVGMLLKIGLAERLDDEGEERTKSKVMLRYFNLSTLGEIAPLTGAISSGEDWKKSKSRVETNSRVLFQPC